MFPNRKFDFLSLREEATMAVKGLRGWLSDVKCLVKHLQINDKSVNNKQIIREFQDYIYYLSICRKL